MLNISRSSRHCLRAPSPNFVDSQGSVHLTVHQSTQDVTVIGLTSGAEYRYNGPLTFTANGTTDQGDALEFTFVNKNHYVGPGGLSNIYFRTRFHAVLDRTTGEVKVDVGKDEVLCS